VVDTFLYVRHGDRLPSRRIDQAISTVDLAPTLFDLAGFTEAGQHSGQSLLGPPIGEEGGVGGDRREGWEVGRALFMDLGQITGLVRGPWKLIRHEGERVELYHLIEDPAERRDRSREEREIRDAMQLQLDAQLAHSVDSVAGAKELDSATVERLRAVGYVE
jgi:arylsulfatase A-like enzyme